MSHERVNADFSQRVVIATETLQWLPSPQANVERRLLDRVGGEVARATSLVRYAPDSKFPAHEHGLGEEFLVLEGVFSDEHGDYPKGTYVRNPPGSRHSPRTKPGCVIFVKLRQMALDDRARVVIDAMAGTTWQSGDVEGHAILPLFAKAGAEQVAMERLDAGLVLTDDDGRNGKEMLILDGDLRDEHGSYRAGCWIRNPSGHRHALRTTSGALFWVKRGHLPPPV